MRQRFRWLTDSQRVTWTAFAILAMFRLKKSQTPHDWIDALALLNIKLSKLPTAKCCLEEFINLFLGITKNAWGPFTDQDL